MVRALSEWQQIQPAREHQEQMYIPVCPDLLKDLKAVVEQLFAIMRAQPQE
jgi:hypothetical protein